MRVRSASWVFVAQAAGLLISFPMSILLARVLGPSGKGTLSIVQQIATMGATLFNFGLGAAFIYYAARREASGRSAVALAALVAGGVAGVLVTVFAMGGDTIAAALLHDTRVALMLLGAAAVFPVLLGQLLNCFVVGTGGIRNASLVNTGALLAQFLTYVALWLLHALTPVTALATWFAVTSVSTLVWARLAWPHTSRGVESGVAPLFRRVYRYGLISWLAGGLGYAALRQDMFLLAYFKGPAAVGVYSVAVTLAELCWFIPSSLVTVLTPKVASEPGEGLGVTLRLSRMTWPVTLLVAGILWLAALVIVPFFYGSQFLGALVPLALILPGIVAYSIAGIPSSYMFGTGHPAFPTTAYAVNVAVNLIANIILIPRLGVAGAALSSALSYTAMAAVMLIMFIRVTGVRLAEVLVPRPEETRELVRAIWSAVRERLGSGLPPMDQAS